MPSKSYNLPPSKSYVSIERHQQIYIDVSLIIKLLSLYRKKSPQQQKKNTENMQETSSFSLINKSSFSNNFYQVSGQQMTNLLSSYKEYGKRFDQLQYSDLLFSLCRKKVCYEFIRQFLDEKYQEKNLQKLHYKMVGNFRALIDTKQPQITLSECLNRSWGQILSKEDIIEDTVSILGQHIGKNWRSNNIKLQKKLQKYQALADQSSKIFNTEPNLDNISINPLEKNHKQTCKKVIQQSTRHILNNLEQLKREMSECQAEMNMAKNNEDKIIQKNKKYSQKMREYNLLKEAYRKRMSTKEQVKPKYFPKEMQLNNSHTNTYQNQKNNEHLAGTKHNYDNQIKDGSQLSKINQERSEVMDKDEQKQVLEDNQSLKNHPDLIQKDVREMGKNIQKKDQPTPQRQLSVSMVLDDKPNKISIHSNKNNNNLSGNQLSRPKQQLRPQEYDELIRILDMVGKNQFRQDRIKCLTEDKGKNLLCKMKTYKKYLSIDTKTLQKPTLQHHNTVPTELSHRKVPQKSSLIISSKQSILQNYIKKVFNHYILEQSESKTFHLFDSNLSGSQLGYNSLVSSMASRSRLDSISPHLRKKFSAEVNQQSFNHNVINEKRRKSLVYPAQRAQYITSRSRINNIQINSRISHGTSGKCLPKPQPHLSIESYSKFIRAFQICSKTVTFNQIMALFRQKSQKKKSICFNQFLELFQLIYKLECEKLQVKFTPVLFDAYLGKEVFNWQKINKVLRIKTIPDALQKGQNRYANEASTQNKVKLVGHSGMLSEDLMEKINASKKPYTKMPCMKRLKTLPVSVNQQLPKSRIQQKVQQVKRLREIQKTRAANQLQAYLQEARKRDQTFTTIKDQCVQKTANSYAKKFKNLESRKKQVRINKRKNAYHTSKIINQSKLRQLRLDSAQYQQQQRRKPIKTDKIKLKDTFQEMSRQIEGIYGRDVYRQSKQNTNPKSINRIKTVQEEQFQIHGQNSRKRNLRKVNQKNEHDDVVQLQRIIGLRQSDDENDDNDDDQDGQQNVIEKPVNYHQKNNSLHYSLLINNQNLQTSKNYQPVQINSRNFTEKEQISSVPHTSTAKQCLKPKANQQDEYLASYLSKQAKIDHLQSMQSSEYFQRDWVGQQDRQRWRVHF